MPLHAYAHADPGCASDCESDTTPGTPVSPGIARDTDAHVTMRFDVPRVRQRNALLLSLVHPVDRISTDFSLGQGFPFPLHAQLPRLARVLVAQHQQNSPLMG
jgi:hypothetical protein